MGQQVIEFVQSVKKNNLRRRPILEGEFDEVGDDNGEFDRRFNPEWELEMQRRLFEEQMLRGDADEYNPIPHRDNQVVVVLFDPIYGMFPIDSRGYDVEADGVRRTNGNRNTTMQAHQEYWGNLMLGNIADDDGQLLFFPMQPDDLEVLYEKLDVITTRAISVL